MAETEEVDEAEQLIAQLLEAQFNPQPADETGEEDAEEGEPADDDADEVLPPGDEETGDEPDAAQTQEPTPAAQVPGPFDTLTDSEKQALLRVRSLLTENPDIAEGFDNLVKQKFEPVPDKTLPPEIDPEDSTSVKLWEQIQEVKAQNEAARAQSETQLRETSQRQVNNDISAAVDKFKVAHPNLSDDDIAHIRDHTAANVNIANVMSNFPNDPVEGIVRSMEIGSMTDPHTRDKVLGVDSKALEAQAEKARKQKLSALSGSTGSGPRTKPQTKKPQNWNEVSTRLAKELEELGGI